MKARFFSPASTPARRAELDTQMLLTIAERGWIVQAVGGTQSEPPFAYSIGVWKTLRLPEILVIGLRIETMHSLVNAAADLAKKTGAALPLELRVPGLLDVDVMFRAVGEGEAADYIGQATRYYRGVHGQGPPPVVQLVYPDRDNRFPGEPACHPGLARQQPLP